MAQMTSPALRPSPAWRELTDGLSRYAPPVGRALLSLIFVLSGAMKFLTWDQTAGYMASKGMPLIPLLLPAAAVLELAGGLSLLLGWNARLGALALFLFLVPATLIFHNFWAHDGMEMQNQMQHFLKNLALMGGLLVVAGFGPGRYSLDTHEYRPGTLLGR